MMLQRTSRASQRPYAALPLVIIAGQASHNMIASHSLLIAYFEKMPRV